eukprot:g5619.t1
MEKVTFGKDLPGYEIGDKNHPAVIVVQEWWGITKTIKDLTEKVHRLGGYRCLLPDLYKGKIGVDKEEAAHLMTNLGWETGTNEITQAVTYLRETGAPKVGITGFCMGGALSFCAAQHAGVDCAALFYGIPPPSACQTDKIGIPLQAHFGKLDTQVGFSDVNTAMKIEEGMKAVGVPCEFHYYEEAGHSFMNEGEEADKTRDDMGFAQPPQSVREEAWRHVMSFFAEHLKAA